MTREELIEQLTARGMEVSDAQSDERLAEILAAMVFAEDAEKAAEANGAGEGELATYEAAVARLREVLDAAAAELDVAPDADPAPDPAPPADDQGETATCVLGPKSPVGALVVGRTRIESRKPGRIPRAEFDRLQGEYDLVEVEE